MPRRSRIADEKQFHLHRLVGLTGVVVDPAAVENVDIGDEIDALEKVGQVGADAVALEQREICQADMIGVKLPGLLECEDRRIDHGAARIEYDVFSFCFIVRAVR